MGNLYIVATPIGNLQDITLRGIETLRMADSIACEDTRKTGILLKKLELSGKHLIPYYEQTEEKRIPEILNALKNGLNIALVSDAGTPTISDPGFKLVRECLKSDIKVVSIPGPSSVISSLVSSGLPTDKFLFVGYPPKKEGHRKTFFQNIKESIEKLTPTIIIFEAPHKLVKTLSEMENVFGNVNIVLARELTKVYEETKTDKISNILGGFKKISPKGEFVILLNSKSF